MMSLSITDSENPDIDTSINTALAAIGNKFSASALKELHNTARQNLITSTQECIVRQLSNYYDDKVLKESQENDCDVYDHNVEEDEDDSDDTNDAPTGTKKSTKKSQSLVCKHGGCGRKFTWPAHYKYHLLTHMDHRPYRCEIDGCNRTFFTAQRLAVHMRTHTGERPFICPEKECGKSFTTAGNLRNHNRIHSGERPYACTEEGCNKRFAESSSLKKHMFVHSGKKPFVCDICGKTFSQSGSRNVHKRRHHNDNESMETIIESFTEESGISESSLDLTNSHNLIMNYKTDNIMNNLFESDDLSTTTILTQTTDVLLLTSDQEIVAITTDFHKSGKTKDNFLQPTDLL